MAKKKRGKGVKSKAFAGSKKKHVSKKINKKVIKKPVKKVSKKIQTKGKVNFNAMAIAGFVLSFLSWFAILGIILCVVSLMQIKKSNQKGRNLSIAGIIIGILVTFGTAIGYLHF